MSNIKNNLKMSLSLVGLTVFVVVLAHWMGLIPDDSDARLNGRIELAEAIAEQVSSLAKTEDVELMSQSLERIVSRNEQITSMVLRKSDGANLSENGQNKASVEKSTKDFINLPILKDGEKWALLEIKFKPLHGKQLGGWLDVEFLKLIMFVAFFSFVIYFLLVTKVLRYLDPYRAIPARVRVAMNALTEGVVLVDDNERIMLVNSSFEKTVGMRMEQLMGQQLSSLGFNYQKRANNAKKILPWCESIKDGKIYTSINLNLDVKENKHAFIVGSTPLKDDKENIRGVLVSFNDVTDVENMNQELKQMSNFLRHELRNALLGASSTINLLKSSELLSESDHKLLNRASRSHRSIKYLLDRITEARNIESSFEGDENSPINISILLSESVDSYSTVYKENAFLFKTDGETLSVLGQEERIMQMLDKLASNAVEHGVTGTPVTISCEKEGDNAKISVTNNGPLLPEDSSSIFDLFASFNTSSTSGTNQGIGLYVVKLIAEAYGGSVVAKNSSDKSGTEFVVKIPLL